MIISFPSISEIYGLILFANGKNNLLTARFGAHSRLLRVCFFLPHFFFFFFFNHALIWRRAERRKWTIWKHQHNANKPFIQTETSWGNQVHCVYVKKIQRYFTNANKPSRMVWPKLYKISISQLYECETQMGSLFWAIAIQAFGPGPPFRSEGSQWPGTTHTHTQICS